MQEQQRVAVFGASGFVGKIVTDALLTKGYAVNAFMRHLGELEFNHADLTIIQGDVNDQDAVEKALQGCVAVIVTINRTKTEDNEQHTDAAIVISASCNKVGIKRVILVAGMGIMSTNGKYCYDSPQFPQEWLDVSKDHIKAFEVYKNAGLQVTAICPPTIVDKEFTGRYVIAVEYLQENTKWKVGNKEVADLIIKEISQPLYIGKIVSITDTD